MAARDRRRSLRSPSDWQGDMDEVGWVRRALGARKWYKADWWFVAISAVIVVVLTVIAMFPGWFAPHDPRAQAGPRNLAPGELPSVEVFVTRVDSGLGGIADLVADTRTPYGVVAGTPSSSVAGIEADRVSAELQDQGREGRVRLRVVRFADPGELLDGILSGEVVAGGAPSDLLEPVLDDYPDVIVTGPVSADERHATTSFLLGTNQLGQDVWSRILWGTRIAFLIGFASALIAMAIGLPLGLIAGFVGGKLDRALSLVMDSLYAFPGLILAIAIAAVLGPSVMNVIVAIAVVYIPTYFRIVRGQTLSTKEELHVEAARSIGARGSSILRRYIFPIVAPSAAIIFSVNVADAILTGAALSFLGLGLPPDIPDWGIDLARGRESIQTAWWLITFPGLAVMLTVLAFTMMGEGLVEIFNPRLRER
jgi:peptide/nickel transport system permease protein